MEKSKEKRKLVNSQFNWNRFSYRVNIDFFKKWSSQMAYILGFTFADGNIYKTTLSWDLKEDRELLVRINKAMDSNYPISKRKASFRLRLSNPVIIDDLRRLGIFPNKSKNMNFPIIPQEYFSHFARGFFDGDGWIYIRKSRNEISAGFSSGSKKYLKKFVKNLSSCSKSSDGNLRIKSKITKRGIRAISYQVDYFWENAYRVLLYLYSGLTKRDLYLERKYKKHKEAIELYRWVKSGGRKWRVIEKKFGPMKETLSDLWKAGYNGPQIAKKLGVHSSSIYRWLISTNTRPVFKEIRRKGIIDG
ncbi:hypothetical protein COS54_01535 [Candidatus Shapirobacteria bacterium CG03_land_8_20_14_0_80_39_12]|uniref:DOD-type homing endonuclease domain-containing protein n=1 Tax=Candidatus Shapirobacteria bacterium CG03_land_8_20_14_0_80_39_12 TaxID=1974879 RepID=A0A2M7BDG2_9BACT|nr:MAG: hypothetical protein COS54_01535 [Candidatus Shapirobacteria bacterium CG03_land_8_20_14_0_80_39_12]